MTFPDALWTLYSRCNSTSLSHHTYDFACAAPLLLLSWHFQYVFHFSLGFWLVIVFSPLEVVLPPLPSVHVQMDFEFKILYSYPRTCEKESQFMNEAVWSSVLSYNLMLLKLNVCCMFALYLSGTAQRCLCSGALWPVRPQRSIPSPAAGQWVRGAPKHARPASHTPAAPGCGPEPSGCT